MNELSVDEFVVQLQAELEHDSRLGSSLTPKEADEMRALLRRIVIRMDGEKLQPVSETP